MSSQAKNLDIEEDVTRGWVSWVIAVLIFGFVGVVWYLDSGDDPTATLFQGLAFGGLIVTILLQRQELILQRRELRRTRIQVEGQKEALERQERVMTQQRYEASFFRLLATQQDIVASLLMHRHDVENRGDRPLRLKLNRSLSYDGRSCFAGLLDMLKRLWRARGEETDTDLFNLAFSRYESDLTHYIRNVEEILRFLAETDLDDRERLGRLFRAQFSPSEITFLFYAGNFRREFSEARELMAQFNFFSALREEDLLHPTHLGLHPIS